MRKQTKIAAIVSAAAVLAIGASMTSFAATGWQEENGVWMYYDKDESLVTQEWVKTGDKYFYLGDNGEMVTDMIVETGEHLYYVGANGARVANEWVRVDNLEDDSEDAPEAFWYYFGSNGRAVRGKDKTKFENINGKSYAFDIEGRMLYGWVDEFSTRLYGDDAYKNAKYYLGDAEDGARVADTWKELTVLNIDGDEENVWFHFNRKGLKSTGDKRIGDKKYTFDANGVMLSGWVKSGDGAADEIAYYKNYSSPEEGALRTKGWFQVVPSGKLNPAAADDGVKKWYYAKGNGELVANELRRINGKYYLFNEKGEMQTGLFNLTFGEFRKLTNQLPVDTAEKVDVATRLGADVQDLYYFGENGDMQYGAQTFDIDYDTYTFHFATSGINKGKAINGKNGNSYYVNGLKVKANPDLIFEAYKEVEGKLVEVVKDSYALIPEVEKYRGMATEVVKEGSDYKEFLVDKDGVASKGKVVKVEGRNRQYKGSANSIKLEGKYIVINSMGTIITSGSRKDGNDVRLRINKGKLEGAYIND